MLKKPDFKRACLIIAAVFVLTAFSACTHKTEDPAHDTTATPTQQATGVISSPTPDTADTGTPTPAGRSYYRGGVGSDRVFGMHA